MKGKTILTKVLIASVLLAGCGNVETVDADVSQIAGNGEVKATEGSELDVTDSAGAQTAAGSVAGPIDEGEEVFYKTAQLDDSNELHLIMVGDILLHTPVENAAYDENSGTYDFHFIFEETKDLISEADVALVNQEVIIGGEELEISGYPSFNAPYAIGDALYDTGFDVVCHATNHCLDKGKRGILNTISFWDENYPDMDYLGINDSQADQDTIFYLEENGMRIAILNYTYGTNGIAIPSDMPYAVDMLEKDSVISDLQEAEENADFTIVCPHWGTEYLLETSKEQEYWSEIFEQNGADLVIGTHPHVIEPVEMRDSGMLVYYSLGNFVNWTSGTGTGVANRMVGGMADVTLAKDASGKVYIKDYGITALVCHVTSQKEGVVVYPLSDYSEDLGLTNEIRSQDSSFSYSYCVELCNTVWGNSWE